MHDKFKFAATFLKLCLVLGVPVLLELKLWQKYMGHENAHRASSTDLARVVQTLDNTIHRINHYPADSVVCFVNIYPLDSDLSGG